MNKHTIAAVAAFFALATSATPSENTFAAVTNDWYNANFTNVYELAQQRLAANSNDVVGAYLMLGWDVSFSPIPAVSNSLTRVISIADTIESPAFSNLYWRLRPMEIAYRNEFLPTVTEEMRLADLHKAYLPRKEIPEIKMLELLWQCNLW